MTKKVAALAVLAIVLLTQQPLAQTGARIFFVDVGTGAGTLIVSPNGTTLLVDGGPPTAGTNRILPLLDALGLPKIDYTIVTHYHIDHMAGMIEVLNSGKVSGGIAYDNGDGADVQPPGTATGSTSTRGTYLNYVAATAAGGATRQTALPGMVIDLGGGMKATIVAAAGKFLSGGSVPFTNNDLNSESISVLVEYNTFDYLVSGDLTGGGSTSTAKTPDIETYVGQMVGDVDVVQLDHHGSTTGNNQAFLSALKAEVAIAQTGETNGFGHPNRESINKFLNTPTTTGATYAGTGVPAAGAGPVFYQNEAPQAGDDRVTLQGYSGAATGAAGTGTILLATDGTTTYSLSTVTDSGVRIPASIHTYPVDGVSSGITTDFKPTVVVSTLPVLPRSTDSLAITAAVNDRESAVSGAMLSYALNGAPQAPVTMTLSSAGIYQATIPPQPDGTRVDYRVSGSAGGQTTTYAGGYFSGVTPVSSLRPLNALGEPLYNGYAARIMATVTASGFSSGTNDDYAQDATGGINIYKSSNGPTPYLPTSPGQVIEARGRVGFLGGRHRLDLTESVEKLTSPFGLSLLSSGAAPTPTATTFAVLSANPEAFEGQLVSIAHVSIVSGTIPATPQPLDVFLTVTDGTANFPLKIDHDTDAEGFTPAASFTAVGILQQDDYLRPFTSGYNLTPRSAADLGAAAAPGAPLLTIADARVDAVTNADGNPPADTIPDLITHVVKVRGAVTSIDFRGGNGIEYYIQDATGGIDVFSASTNFGPFAIGDNVEAIGAITQFNGLTEITATSVVSLPGTTVVTPQVVTLAQLADGAGEALEGRLIRVNHVTITAGAFPALNASGNLTIADATGTTVLRIDSDTDIDGTAAPSGVFSVIALASQFDSTAPFDSGYQILPRGLSDLILTGPTCPAISIGGSLPAAVAGAPYSQTLTASGGTAPYVFSLAAGSLPAGLTLSSTGVVSGTPTVPGTAPVTVLATAADGCPGTASFTITVGGVFTATPSPMAFGAVTTGTGSSLNVTIKNTSAGSITLATPFAITGTNASQFSVASPAATTLAANGSTTASVIFQPTTVGAKSAVLTISAGAATVAVSLTGTGAPVGGGTSVILISEFRTRGPGTSPTGTGSATDEFVEIYNNSNAPVNISGYKMAGANSAVPSFVSVRATVPDGVILPGRAHYLFVGAGYTGAAVGNRTFGTGITDDGGIAIFDATGTAPLDAVGMSINSAYKEGSILTVLAANTKNQSYERKTATLNPLTLLDNNNNAADFQLLNGTAPNLANPQNIVLQATPAALDFGSVVVPASQSRNVAITNLTVAPVTLNPPTVTGGVDFGASLPAVTTLPAITTTAAAAATTVAVTFHPSDAGPKTDELKVTSSGGGAVTVPLSGIAIVDHTPPVLTLPTDLTVPATGPTTGVSFTATATDNIDGLVTPVCTPASGNDFPVGVTTVTCIATDAHGNSASGSFTVTITDTAPPELTVPTTITTEATGTTTTVTFTATATDVVDGPILPVCTPASGFAFPVGTTSVSCTATDTHGLSATAHFDVTVTDTTPPALTVPATITVEATGVTTPVSFTASATDLGVSIAPVCTPASGFAFPVGTTSVSCTATDTHGLSATAHFDVTVTDTTPPALVAPSDITAAATSPAGAIVTFAATASDVVDGPLPATCGPPSGSTFAIGATTVTCTASDLRGNSANRTFTVTVTESEAPGRMTGNAAIEIGVVTHEVDFKVQERVSGAEVGSLRYRVRTKKPGRDLEDKFEATLVTAVSFFNEPGVSPGKRPASGIDTVSFAGTGRWNLQAGYTFSAVAIDAGEPGRGRDSFAITVKDATGHVVATVTALITGGNIQSSRAKR